MARHKRNIDELLLNALLCGGTVATAAQAAQISERTAHRRLADPVFKQRLQERLAEIVKRQTDLLTAAGVASIKTMIALQDNSMPAGVRLGAARSVVEYGIKMRDSGELIERIAALEAQAASTTPTPGAS